MKEMDPAARRSANTTSGLFFAPLPPRLVRSSAVVFALLPRMRVAFALLSVFFGSYALKFALLPRMRCTSPSLGGFRAGGLTSFIDRRCVCFALLPLLFGLTR
jgi:hypothetical protein